MAVWPRAKLTSDCQTPLLSLQDNIAEALVRALQSCPDSVALRKEVLISMRHVLTTSLRGAFGPALDILLDEDTLVGRGHLCQARPALPLTRPQQSHALVLALAAVPASCQDVTRTAGEGRVFVFANCTGSTAIYRKHPGLGQSILCDSLGEGCGLEWMGLYSCVRHRLLTA